MVRFQPVRRLLTILPPSPARTGPPWQSARARGDLPVVDEVGELVQDEPGIRDRSGIPGMTRISAFEKPPQTRTRLAKWSLIVDQTPDDQAPQVEMGLRLATARAPIEDRGPALSRERTANDRDLEDADVRDSQLDGRPLLDSFHA
jgi:hypothetical protein